MKRFLLYLLITAPLALASWGYRGHKAIASIAQKHLTVTANKVVTSYLGTKSISDVASWADEVRNQPEYRQTASWHFLNLPIGYDYEQFVSAVRAQEKPNIYTAILSCEKELSDRETPLPKKQEALKFLIHFVGDAHQPMHISRAEDKGGNSIQVRFDDRGTNLHSVWDSKLIDREGLTDEQIVSEYDKATPGEIEKWQNDDPITWLWESYQYSTRLYSEVEKNANMGQQYYDDHIGLVHQRVEQAGIRLAGLLNKIFKVSDIQIATRPQSPVHNVAPDAGVTHVDLKAASAMIDQKVITDGKIYSFKVFPSMVLINLGGEYPNQVLTVVLKGQAKEVFTKHLISGKTLGVTGTVTIFKDKPEIEVTDNKSVTVF